MTAGPATPDQYFAAKRATVLKEAAALPLPDAAARIVDFNNFNCDPICEPITIAELGRSEPKSDQEEWVRAALTMFRSADAPGGAYLTDPVAATPIIDAFKRAHPGFAEDSYRRAIGYGMWQMR